MKAGDIKVCNCAGCQTLLVAPSSWSQMTPAQRTNRRKVTARVGDRPYCEDCLVLVQSPSREDVERERG